MEHVKELLSEYIDGALAEAERRKVDSHLFTCAECRLELDELKAVAKMVGGLRSKALPAGFMDRLQKRRDQEARGSIVPPWLLQATKTHWMRPVSVVLCAMIVMVVAFDRMNRVFSPTARILSPAAAPASAPVRVQDELSSIAGQTMHQMKDSDARAFADAKTPAESHMTPLQPLAEEQAKLRVKSAAPTAIRGASADTLTIAPTATRGLSAARPEAARQRLEGAKRGAEEPLAYDKGFSKNAFAPVSGAAGAGGDASLPASPPLGGRLDGAAGKASADEAKNDDGLRRLAVGELRAAKEESLKTLEKRDLPQKVAAKKAKAPVDGHRLAEQSFSSPALKASSDNFVIRSTDELQTVWTRLRIEEPLPIVDFSSEMLILVRAREPGAVVKLNEIRREKSRIVVDYQENRLNLDLTPPRPYAYQVIATTALPVVFEKKPAASSR